MDTNTDAPVEEGVLKSTIYFVIGLIILPFLVLLRPSMLRNMGSFLRGAARDANLISLSSPKHRHRITFPTIETDHSGEQHAAAATLMFDLAQKADWAAMGDQLEAWDAEKACCIANKRLIHSGLEGAIEGLIDGRPGAYRCEALDVARIPDELVDEAIEFLKENPDRFGVAGLIVAMLTSQCWDLRGQMWADSVSDDAWDQIGEKYYTALWVLDLAKIEQRNSGLLFGERQGLLFFSPESDRVIDDWFAAAVKADPGNSAPMASMGNLMLPRWGGDYERLEVTARQAVAWTSEHMGKAAYAFVYHCPLEIEDVPLFFLDMDLYSEAIHDLVKYRGCSPVYLPNLSECLFEWADQPYPHGMTDKEDRDHWDNQCHEMRLLALKIIEDYLPGIHAPSWRNGERGALQMISRAMGQELEDGLSLVVGPRGIRGVDPKA